MFTNSQHAPGRVVLLAFAFFFLFGVLGAYTLNLLCTWQGLAVEGVMEAFGPGSTRDERYFVKGLLLINHLFSFLLPVIAVGILFYRRKWPKEFGLSPRLPMRQALLGLGMILLAFPLAQGLFELNSWLLRQTPWFEELTAIEAASETLQLGLLTMSNSGELLSSLLVMAILPALAEELFFRGVVQQHLVKVMGRAIPAILLTALLFSLVHFQAQRFLAIFWLGGTLGLVYHWTGNLWIPVLGHFLNNGLQVMAAWLYQDRLAEFNQPDAGGFHWSVMVLSLAFFVFFAKLLKPPPSDDPAA